MIDYYEFLQISPNADVETIHRVYRYLAARFHPDNPKTANPEQFKLVSTAYSVLSDRMKRSEYDAARLRQRQEPFSSSVDFMDTLDGELNRRLAVLAVLYRKRRTNPSRPEVTLGEIEAQMGFPRDYLDFTVWYLNRKGYIAKADNAEYTLTAEGVDFVEGQRPASPNLNKMLTSGSEPTAEEIAEANETAAAAPATFDMNAVADAPPPAADPIILPASMETENDQRFGNPERRAGKFDPRKFKFERRFNVDDRRVDGSSNNGHTDPNSNNGHLDSNADNRRADLNPGKMRIDPNVGTKRPFTGLSDKRPFPNLGEKRPFPSVSEKRPYPNFGERRADSVNDASPDPNAKPLSS